LLGQFLRCSGLCGIDVTDTAGECEEIDVPECGGLSSNRLVDSVVEDHMDQVLRLLSTNGGE
jgi:hypothetical protein